jgi:hypothetical protein
MLKALQATGTLLLRSQAAASVSSIASASRATMTNVLGSFKTRSVNSFRRMSTAASAIEEKYAGSLQAVHWAMAAGILTCVGTVKTAQWIESKETKGTLMMVHKSTALLVLAMLGPRLLLRLTTKIPAAVPGNALEKLGANLSHLGFYGLMIFMPVSGVVMGWYGGKVRLQQGQQPLC